MDGSAADRVLDHDEVAVAGGDVVGDDHDSVRDSEIGAPMRVAKAETATA